MALCRALLLILFVGVLLLIVVQTLVWQSSKQSSKR